MSGDRESALLQRERSLGKEVIAVLKLKLKLPRLGLPTAAAALFVLPGLLGLALAQAVHVSSIKEEGDRIAQEFRIGSRPSHLTAEHVERLLSKLPGFGERTVEVLKTNAPYRKLLELAQLQRETDSGPRRLLSDKQLLLIAIFFDLEP